MKNILILQKAALRIIQKVIKKKGIMQENISKLSNFNSRPTFNLYESLMYFFNKMKTFLKTTYHCDSKFKKYLKFQIKIQFF